MTVDVIAVPEPAACASLLAALACGGVAVGRRGRGRNGSSRGSGVYRLLHGASVEQVQAN